MQLFHRDFGGAGKPRLLFIHGLLGSSRNWQTVGAELSASYHVCALDLRNHGQSPKSPEQSFEAMRDDVLEWMDAHGVLSASIVGHSLGGKVSMALACHAPQRVDALCVVDIAPKFSRLDRHEPSFRAMHSVNLETLKSRAEAEAQISKEIRELGMVKFLSTNLDRDDAGRWFWRVNVDALSEAMPTLSQPGIDSAARFDGPAFFVIGGRSDYVSEKDHATILVHFPKAKIETIVEAGHNPHIDSRAKFIEVLKRFL